eukprot:1158731-Pelagomonas_calceolata.AAC.13
MTAGPPKTKGPRKVRFAERVLPGGQIFKAGCFQDYAMEKVPATFQVQKMKRYLIMMSGVLLLRQCAGRSRVQ